MALTHLLRVFGPENWVRRMVESLRRLGSRLGVLLVQLPPAFAVDDQRLAYFLKLLPRRLRVALEFRNSTWYQDATFALVEVYGLVRDER